MIVAVNQNLLCQLRLAVPNALSSTRFRVNFDLQPQSREANA